MSRRPVGDEIASVVVIAAEARSNVMEQSVLQSNLLSNENVIAFAKGVVIDDGSRNATNSIMQTKEDQVGYAVNKCMGKHTGRK